MSRRQFSTRIPLQVGVEIRIGNNCELRVSNPTLAIISDDRGHPLDPEEADDAALDYRFDPETAEHVFKLLSPAKSRVVNRVFNQQRNRSMRAVSGL